MLTCTKSTCSGHCKTGRRLFTCRTRGIFIASGFCNDEDKPDPLSLPAEPLDPLRSLSITATQPFIGCANITGLPNGCPASGTTGITNKEGNVTMTTFGYREQFDILTNLYRTSFDVPGGVVEVEMFIVHAVQNGGENVTEDGSFADVRRSGHGSEFSEIS
eukprot:jgi/Ulvmu1/5697/UM024_0044.1